MADEKQEPEPTQKTPKGLTILVPTREEFLRNLEKVAPPLKPEGDNAQRDKSPDGEGQNT